MEVEWFLCSICMIELSQTLHLEALPKPPEKGKCRMCGRKCFGTYYKVRYKTKGESTNG